MQVEPVDIRAQRTAALDALARAGEVLRQRHAEFDHGASPHRAEAHALGNGAFIAGGQGRRVLYQRVVRVDLQQPAFVEQAHHACVDLEHQTLDVALRGGGGAMEHGAMEHQGSIVVADEPAIEANQVVMRVQIQAAAVALHEGDRSGLGVVHASSRASRRRRLRSPPASTRWIAVHRA